MPSFPFAPSLPSGSYSESSTDTTDATAMPHYKRILSVGQTKKVRLRSGCCWAHSRFQCGMGWAESRCGCGSGELSPDADVAGTYRTQRVSSLRGGRARPPAESPSAMSPTVCDASLNSESRRDVANRAHHALSVRRPTHKVTTGFAYNTTHAATQLSTLQHKTTRCHAGERGARPGDVVRRWTTRCNLHDS